MHNQYHSVGMRDASSAIPGFFLLIYWMTDIFKYNRNEYNIGHAIEDKKSDFSFGLPG